MRGKVLPDQNKWGIRRITPAYAGKSGNVDHDYAYIEDHPRLCGEKMFQPPSPQPVLGSPPPMRGKVPKGRKSQQ